MIDWLIRCLWFVFYDSISIWYSYSKHDFHVVLSEKEMFPPPGIRSIQNCSWESSATCPTILVLLVVTWWWCPIQQEQVGRAFFPSLIHWSLEEMTGTTLTSRGVCGSGSRRAPRLHVSTTGGPSSSWGWWWGWFRLLFFQGIWFIISRLTKTAQGNHGNEKTALSSVARRGMRKRWVTAVLSVEIIPVLRCEAVLLTCREEWRHFAVLKVVADNVSEWGDGDNVE